MSAKILCVDDDQSLLSALERNLRKQFQVETAGSAELGLVALKEKGPFAVVLSDMGMPGMDGGVFLQQAATLSPDTVRVMLTGYNDQQTAIRAVNEGHVFCFLNKPCDAMMLLQTLVAAVKQYQLIVSERELLEQTLNGSVKLLTDILSMADPLSFGRAKLLRDYAHEYLEGCGHEDTQSWEIELAAMLLSLGNITIPPGLLDKVGAGAELSQDELDVMARVSETGFGLLSNIPRLEIVAQIVRYQNKRFDGMGFPVDKVREHDIPFGARLLKVLKDLIERETGGQSRIQAITSMRSHLGHYDATILENCSKHLKVQPSREQLDAQVGTIPLAELTNRHVLVSPLTTREGMVIAPEGTEITNLILQKIRNFGSFHVLNEPIQVRLRG